MTTITQAFTEEVAAYAVELLEAGFTVYLPSERSRTPETWFHYSREVDGRTCYGIYQGPSRDNFWTADHTMPIVPSRLNGSGAHVGAKWGDPATLGFDEIPVTSVRMAEIVARPENWCPYNAEPTREALEACERAHLSNRGTPQRFYRGATLRNDPKPWGIGTVYLPATLDAPEVTA